MKRTSEDIDRSIGMPDIDAEWTRFEREVISTSSARPERFHLSRAAAVIIVVLGISLTALASVYVVRRIIPSRRRATATAVSTLSRDTLVQPVPQADTLAVFNFENVDMQTIARALGEHYGVEPVFHDEALKTVRLYARIEKDKTLDEVVTLLNHFKKVRLTIADDKLIIERRIVEPKN